jgi:hypothetical protein
MTTMRIALMGVVVVFLLWLLKPNASPATGDDVQSGVTNRPLMVTGYLNPQEKRGDRGLPAPALFARRLGGLHGASPHTYVGPMSLHEAVADWPPSLREGKTQLENFAQAIGLHDAILVNPYGSDEEIIENAKGLGVPEEFVRENLESVFSVNDSLGAHLQRALVNPELRQVHDLLVSQQVQVNFNDDLLVDAFRFCSFNTSFGELMESQADSLVPEGQQPFPCDLEEIQRCLTVRAKALETIANFFMQRFQVRHGLPPEMASAVVEALAGMEVRTAPPPTMAVPRVKRL